MVCDRCVRVVKEELQHLGLDVRSIQLGEAVVGIAFRDPDQEQIRTALAKHGFELLDDRQSQIIERIKIAVLKLVRDFDPELPRKLKDSEFMAKEVGQDYHKLTTLFSSTQGITVEKYIILQRIEFVKELLRYNELTLSEIAYRLGYSSVSHLSNQFKKTTGLSATEYRNLKVWDRKPLDRIHPGTR
ncbi:MAG: helix-turn-helix transcriptional regulator [Ignavibacteria bacterium]|nr:helix-turn-helix transcriptional regulator [Ignavibacteria bacterium]